MFYFNIVVGLLLYLFFFAIAPWVANFYDNPELTTLMRVICLSVIFNSLVVVQRALLIINIDFKTQAKASLTAALVSGAVGIGMAYQGFSYWSLAIQQLMNLGLNTFLLWIFLPIETFMEIFLDFFLKNYLLWF